MGVGVESGLFETSGRLYDTCCCAVYDGEHHHVGYSCCWELPPVVSRLVIEEKMNLTDAFNAAGICDDPQIGDKGGVLGVLTGNRVTRGDYTVQCVQMAILTM